MMRSLFITLLAAIALLNKRADAAGTLVLTVADSQTIPNNADTVVTIALANPTASQAAVTPTIAASLEGASTTFAIPSAAMSTGVLATQTTWTTKAIAESATTGTAASNTITFTLRPVKALVATQKITIAGLTGSGTVDSGTLTVAGAGAAKVGSAGVWTQNTGTLVLTVAGSQSIVNDADTVLEIALTNPTASQAAVTPTIAVSVEGATSAFGIASAAMSTGVLGTQTTWTTKDISDVATTGTITSNTITFTLRPAKTLVATQKITIDGLTGSGTADSGTLAVAGTNAARFGSTGVWTQSTASSGGDSGGSSDDSTGAIVGGVIGGLVVVAIVVYLVMNQKKNQNKVSASA